MKNEKIIICNNPVYVFVFYVFLKARQSVCFLQIPYCVKLGAKVWMELEYV